MDVGWRGFGQVNNRFLRVPFLTKILAPLWFCNGGERKSTGSNNKFYHLGWDQNSSGDFFENHFEIISSQKQKGVPKWKRGTVWGVEEYFIDYYNHHSQTVIISFSNCHHFILKLSSFRVYMDRHASHVFTTHGNKTISVTASNAVSEYTAYTNITIEDLIIDVRWWMRPPMTQLNTSTQFLLFIKQGTGTCFLFL